MLSLYLLGVVLGVGGLDREPFFGKGVHRGAQTATEKTSTDPDVNAPIGKLVREAGFQLSNHTVTTADNCSLTIFKVWYVLRIPQTL